MHSKPWSTLWSMPNIPNCWITLQVFAMFDIWSVSVLLLSWPSQQATQTETSYARILLGGEFVATNTVTFLHPLVMKLLIYKINYFTLLSYIRIKIIRAPTEDWSHVLFLKMKVNPGAWILWGSVLGVCEIIYVPRLSFLYFVLNACWLHFYNDHFFMFWRVLLAMRLGPFRLSWDSFLWVFLVESWKLN